MEVKGIHWVGIRADNWDETVGFYRDVLGLPMRYEGSQPGPTESGVRFAEFVAANGDVVEVFGANLPEGDLFRAPMAGFLVDDVRASRALMEARGAEFVGPVARGGPWEWSYFRAPGGAVHQLLAKLNGR